VGGNVALAPGTWTAWVPPTCGWANSVAWNPGSASMNGTA